MGTHGNETSNWQSAKEAAQAYYQDKLDKGSPVYPNADEALNERQSAFDRYYGEDAQPSLSEAENAPLHDFETLGHEDSRSVGFDDLYGKSAAFQQATYEEIYGRASDAQIEQEVERQQQDNSLDIER